MILIVISLLITDVYVFVVVVVVHDFQWCSCYDTFDYGHYADQ